MFCGTMNTMKRLFAYIFIIILIAGGYVFRDDVADWYRRVRGVEIVPAITAQDAIREIEKKVFAPSPLRTTHDTPDSFLTEKGVIAWTNRERLRNGNLPPLSSNALLHAAAAAKVEDMFSRQYFEHVSPTGKGPADLAEAAGYEYIAIGENLALGNFENDEVLVTAWMNSPGHRANIVNNTYTEIGVAVKRGVFEGRMVWLAVQEFGRPMSLCPAPDKNIEIQINATGQLLKELEARIKTLRDEIDQTPRRHDSGYNEKVELYNTLVNEYNKSVAELKELIAAFNDRIRIFNECIQ